MRRWRRYRDDNRLDCPICRSGYGRITICRSSYRRNAVGGRNRRIAIGGSHGGIAVGRSHDRR